MAKIPADRTTAQRRATLGAFVGTAIEWYDFYIFGTAAALVFSKVFYPQAAEGAALMASFATFWVGFLARPLGGIIFGHFGDKIGRKNTLIITLMLMGIATAMIGVLPGYASIGIAAPVLLILLRALQGIAVGGEWGGAVLLATENASEQNKGRAGTWVQQGSPAGSILATLAFLLVGLLPNEQFLSWGWRIPFLFSAVLVVVGLVIRAKVEESAAFTEAKARRKVAEVPVVTVFRVARTAVMLGVLASILGISSAYFGNTFLLAWTTGQLKMDRQVILNIFLATAILQFIWQPMAARIAERIGVLKLMLGALGLALLMIVPLFLALLSGNIVFLATMMVLNVFGGSAYYALLASTLAAAFPIHVRYTGVSVAYQLCATIIGGSTPLVAQALLVGTGPWSVAAFYALLVIATATGVVALERYRLKSLPVDSPAMIGS
ncbi:MFS family permease [Paenarthrobacter nicotinovorans]|uniref:MFS transporter n=1 Tax=Micrococcaceae TaxID=1268 RepID=UPI0008773C70|nr:MULTISPECIES: MFS transporter [Micrococcaceae]MDR6436701.1 MFS family permease [Paenarthrobacter nicotinovorans]SCZ56866.1 Predicted arabinose efflux permease, MFS family [Arthrobacter sp. UNCCL28]